MILPLLLSGSLVLQVNLVKAHGGSKYHWDEVKVLEVVENKSDHKIRIGEKMMIAHYGWDPGIAEGESVVQLVPYNDAKDHPWKLTPKDPPKKD